MIIVLNAWLNELLINRYWNLNFSFKSGKKPNYYFIIIAHAGSTIL